ncbi:MAG: nicotinamidase-related amidase [Zhongshania marina]|jgi:nicotinamidase-related amidase
MFTIAARPYPYTLPSGSKPCLIVIDMQRDFVEAGGFGEALGNDVSLLTAIVPTVKRLLDCFRALDLPIVHTREAHKPDLSDCPAAKLKRGGASIKIGDLGPMGHILIDGEMGNELLPELRALPDELEMTKPGKGAFYATPLQDYLQDLEITHLLFAGVTTEVCVQTSMREANDRGYECLIVEDATESYFPEFKRATIDMIIAQGGIVGWAASCEQVITGLEQAYG